MKTVKIRAIYTVITIQQYVATYDVCMENVPSRISVTVVLAGKAKHAKKV